MTSATIHLVAPTSAERALLRLAARVTAHVEQRVARRAERRELALDLLRERQSRRPEPIRYERVLQDLGSRML